MPTGTIPADFHPALLVIDMQNDFCPPDGSLAVTGGRDIVPCINKLLSTPAFALRVATKDYHPTDHISFACNHPAPDNVPFTSFARVINPNNTEESYTTRLWPEHCVQGTDGAELVNGLNIDAVDLIIEKGQDKRVEMYSVFYDPFKVSESTATAALKEKGVTWVYVVGLAYDYCVKASALDARTEGFEVVVVKDGTRAVDASKQNLDEVDDQLRQAGVRVVSMDDEEMGWLSL
ncbi:NAD(+) salvage pathway protein [Pleurotus ostreatus]|uniref:nicotinamidase n=1 Tax=Pleurotus ostreatus TaxID=5322 RepID=A0A8H6ZJW7_PLEOS|nr:NAD(+) salvage pathway protein [Pleurotus ostreatus]KAF7416166.1 NAD(+) salvage pathway protein [Pleurotus ostreatus]KAJ8689001.1 NAD(+) salvage pathway protein [Pleurotus ostreatus]